MDAASKAKEPLTKTCLKCHRDFSENVGVCPDDQTTLTAISLASDDLVGSTFCERYKIIDILGGGGMGKVYHAHHLLMQRPVAIKILHAKLSNNVAALKRFRVEAQFASSLSHPNILSIHDFGVSGEGNPYMVMDYLEGENLSTLLESKTRLPAIRAINIFTQICSALGHAHAKGIIHRDVKPSNIMLVPFENRRDFVKIVDFGIAKVLNSEDSGMEQLTRTGEIFGSPLYMSPEQCRGKELDTRADIYSLGAVMYLTLTGKSMFETNNALETMFKHVQETPAQFAQISPDAALPEALEAVVFRCLAKEPDERYQRMSDVKAALEGILPDLGVSQPMSVNTVSPSPPVEEKISHNVESADEAETTQTQIPTISATTPPDSLPVPISNRVKAGVVAACLVLLGVGSVFFLTQKERSVPIQEPSRVNAPVEVPVVSPPIKAAPPGISPLPAIIAPSPSVISDKQKIRAARKVVKSPVRVKKTVTYSKRKVTKSTPKQSGFKRLKNSLRKLFKFR